MNRSFLAPGLSLAAALLLGGCAALNDLQSEVSTYGAWPAERKAGSYAFERLPSQQSKPERQQVLEDAARPALDRAGFKPAAEADRAEYLIQLSARVSNDSPWYDGHPGFRYGGARLGLGGWSPGPWGFGGQFGGSFGPGFDPTWRFDREVALLIRDRSTGQLLYEARASNFGSSASIDRLLAPMFSAALAGFPAVASSPRNISAPLTLPR